MYSDAVCILCSMDPSQTVRTQACPWLYLSSDGSGSLLKHFTVKVLTIELQTLIKIVLYEVIHTQLCYLHLSEEA